MSNGTAIAAEVAAALREVGTATGEGPLIATITRAPVDAATKPWEAASVTPETTYSLAVIRDSWRYGEINGTKIRASDLKLMAEAGVTLPTTADKLTLDGEVYEIVDVMPEAVGGVDLYYIIAVRK